MESHSTYMVLEVQYVPGNQVHVRPVPSRYYIYLHIAFAGKCLTTIERQATVIRARFC
jgi:hypothetical protein